MAADVKMRFCIAMGLIFALVVIGGCVRQVEERPTPVITTTPTDKESCEALGGRWGTIGLQPEEECNLPTSDAGKECSDWGDCEGACIADLSQEDLEEAPEGVVHTKGKCSASKIVVGCHAFVEDGKVYGILCVD